MKELIMQYLGFTWKFIIRLLGCITEYHFRKKENKINIIIIYLPNH